MAEVKDKLVTVEGLSAVYNDLHKTPVQLQITTGQWNGSGPYTYTANATNVTADTVIEVSMDDTINNLTSDLNVTPGAGSFTISTDTLPTDTINVTIVFVGVVGDVEVQVLDDVYSRTQVDSIVADITPTPWISTIQAASWSGSGSDWYITVTAANVTANSILEVAIDGTNSSNFTGTKIWAVPAAGQFTIHTDSKPSGAVTVKVRLDGTVGEAQYQVLADVYSKSQTDALIQQSTANIYEKLANNLIVSEQGTVSVPNSTATICYSITLTRGKWLVIGCGDWAANGTGYRQIAFASGLNPDRRRAVTTMGIAEKEAYQQVSQFVSTTGETVTLYALQNSGAALNVYSTLYAMRIGDIN